MKDFFEKPFWINSYDELFFLYEKNMSLPFEEQDKNINKEMKKINYLFKKKFGKFAFDHFIKTSFYS